MKQKKARQCFNLFTVIFIIFLFLSLIVGLFIGGCFSSAMSYKDAEHYVSEYSAELFTVVDYLNSFQGEDLFCSKNKGHDMIYHTNTQKWYEIEEKEVRRAIQCLFDKSRCTRITKTNQTISFTLFSKSTDAGGGIAFTSSDGLDIEFLTFSKALSAPFWYYYISDFNKWRLQH